MEEQVTLQLSDFETFYNMPESIEDNSVLFNITIVYQPEQIGNLETEPLSEEYYIESAEFVSGPEGSEQFAGALEEEIHTQGSRPSKLVQDLIDKKVTENKQPEYENFDDFVGGLKNKYMSLDQFVKTSKTKLANGSKYDATILLDLTNDFEFIQNLEEDFPYQGEIALDVKFDVDKYIPATYWQPGEGGDIQIDSISYDPRFTKVTDNNNNDVELPGEIIIAVHAEIVDDDSRASKALMMKLNKIVENGDHIEYPDEGQLRDNFDE